MQNTDTGLSYLVICPVGLVKAKFHYAIWFEAGSTLVADRFEAGRGPASSC